MKLKDLATELNCVDENNSPLKEVENCVGDASKVAFDTENLRIGFLGQEIRTVIDTRKAGSGELTAECKGPEKPAFCHFIDNNDTTYTLCIRPQQIGKHSLEIKYNDTHVNGSPFDMKILGYPDANKVNVYGPGVSHGVLSTFKSRFVCDTQGAGTGQLTVKIRGPKSKK